MKRKRERKEKKVIVFPANIIIIVMVADIRFSFLLGQLATLTPERTTKEKN